MPSISGQSPSVHQVTAQVPRWVGVGTTTTLPATLSNDRLSLRFVSHATHGVTLDTLTQTDTGTAHAWTNAQTSDDGIVTGQLWRVATQTAGDAAETGAECGPECGVGLSYVQPSATVSVSTTEDADGRPALLFRWSALSLPTSGTIDVALLVALGTDDTAARWSIHVTRSGAEADGIEWVEAPILAIQGPVPARSGMTHAASQVRARVLVPAADMPALGSENVPLTLWDGEHLLTGHPAGDEAATSQPLQFCAIYAGDPQDAASYGRVLFLGCDDRSGYRKDFTHAGTSAGNATSIFLWAHRYVPAWASWPVVDVGSTDRTGNEFHARYHVLTAALRSPTAAWTDYAAIYYRQQVVDGMGARSKRRDTDRTDLARGYPIAVDLTTTDLDATNYAAVADTWADEVRSMAGATAVYQQTGNLSPTAAAGPSANVTFTDLRGCNYLPMCEVWSHSLHLSLVPLRADSSGRPTTSGGFFHEPFARASLDQLEAAGFNNIRVWGSFMGWVADPEGYLASLRTLARLCAERDIGITYVMWNIIPAGAASGGGSAYDIVVGSSYLSSTVTSALWTLADAWQGSPSAPDHIPTNDVDLSHYPEPLTAEQWNSLGRFGEWSDTTFQGLVRDYIVAMARFWGNDADGVAAYHSTDLYNEPNGVSLPGDAQANIYDFIAKMERAMRDLQPNLCATVGWAAASSGRNTAVAALGTRLSYVSYHGYAYSATPEEFATIAASLDASVETANDMGLPTVWSEFFVVPENRGQMQDYLDIALASGVGTQSWCYIHNRSQTDRGTTAGGFSWPLDGLITVTQPALSITTSTTLEYRVFGGECGNECGAECELGFNADKAAIEAWVAA